MVAGHAPGSKKTLFLTTTRCGNADGPTALMGEQPRERGGAGPGFVEQAERKPPRHRPRLIGLADCQHFIAITPLSPPRAAMRSAVRHERSSSFTAEFHVVVVDWIARRGPAPTRLIRWFGKQTHIRETAGGSHQALAGLEVTYRYRSIFAYGVIAL